MLLAWEYSVSVVAQPQLCSITVTLDRQTLSPAALSVFSSSLYLFCPSTLPTKRGKCSGLLLSVFITLRDVVLLCVHSRACLTPEEEQHKDTSVVTCKRGYEEHKRGRDTHANTHTTLIFFTCIFGVFANGEPQLNSARSVWSFIKTNGPVPLMQSLGSHGCAGCHGPISPW